MSTASSSGVQVCVDARGHISRRTALHAAGAALAGSFWLKAFSAGAEDMRRKRKACILLWLSGGPSQFETFDPKPGAETQGPTKAIATSVPGIHIAEHWPRTATVMGDLALVRSMTSKEGN